MGERESAKAPSGAEGSSVKDSLSIEERAYVFAWQHGPAPGLTFYKGRETAYGPDADTAMRRAKRIVCQRGCFDPGCITLKLVGGEYE